MSIIERLHYYNRIVSAYLLPGESQLSFWHELPQGNPRARRDALGEYYMNFPEKARYTAHLDRLDIPMLDYRGKIGLQYNPIAISQWGLGNYNLARQAENDRSPNSTSATESGEKFLAAGDWLCSHLEQNSHGLWVWNHHFDWEYRDKLKAPWYSALAQGQGISMLLRAHAETGMSKYLHAAERAFASFLTSITGGGILSIDQQGNPWFEEYLVNPPTHILNGFLWASWGVLDYFLVTGNGDAKRLFEGAVQTLTENLHRYDFGFWSLYEQSGTLLPMIASSFYHQLHIVQLLIMYRLTGEQIFADYADRWQKYARRSSNRARALCYKSVFKLFYY